MNDFSEYATEPPHPTSLPPHVQDIAELSGGEMNAPKLAADNNAYSFALRLHEYLFQQLEAARKAMR